MQPTFDEIRATAPTEQDLALKEKELQTKVRFGKNNTLDLYIYLGCNPPYEIDLDHVKTVSDALEKYLHVEPKLRGHDPEMAARALVLLMQHVRQRVPLDHQAEHLLANPHGPPTNPTA